ncbi:acyl-coenzyme A thioesterase 9, mitochondrial-like [Planoprotostelium fungivorum]|uniref:Acyl-coenzyme A thioesterase 9, mitochondrial-like n=1 Tax=Planoprotostelium fungivorum TaxID=1890364 RepID=A0A2P6N858_9EUKA|nr:acyl-coenzyme A thioesterase 9, mitochondrial-like [Planoprotostelium fungivorum]
MRVTTATAPFSNEEPACTPTSGFSGSSPSSPQHEHMDDCPSRYRAMSTKCRALVANYRNNAVARGAISSEHLLLNSNPVQASTTRVSSPDVTRDNQNDDYVSRWLYKEEELKRTLPLTFALLNSRGAHGWASLIGNIRIKERARGGVTGDTGDTRTSCDSFVELYIPLSTSEDVFKRYRGAHGWASLIGNIRIKERARGGVTGDTGDTRTSCDSFVELYIPLSTSEDVFKRYRLFETDRIRFGKVLEDLDALAADIAYRHCGRDANEKYTIVTAGVDRLNILGHVTKSCDVCLRGSVVLVGTTSMEVHLLILTKKGEEPENLLSQTTFTMVCRDQKTYKGAKVSTLQIVTDYDKWASAQAQKRRDRRAESAKVDLRTAPPRSDEIEEIHRFFLGSSSVTPTSELVPMSSTVVQTIEVMHGQERNVHNKIFGGHLMRLAFELASISAYQTTTVYPVLRAMDDVRFYSPVEIGSILNLKSSVQMIETQKRLVYVTVVAEMTVTSLLEKPKKITNEFHFVFLCDRLTPLPTVMPNSYTEVMEYINRKRRAASIANDYVDKE